MFRPAVIVILFVLFAVLVSVGNRTIGVTTHMTLGNAEYQVAVGAFTEPHITATSFLIFDAESGVEFGAREPSALREMASVTKLITAHTALGTSTADASTTVSWKAVATNGRSGHLKAGERYTLRELIFPLLLESSNDAAEAIAEANGRERFIRAMNTTVQAIGMASTSVADPSGLSPKNISTAKDLKMFLMHLFATDRHILDITTLSSYVGTKHVWRNNDPVATSSGFMGGKHGYTDTAGRTIAFVAEESFLNGDVTRPIGIVLLDSSDLVGDIARLRSEFDTHVSYGFTPLAPHRFSQ